MATGDFDDYSRFANVTLQNAMIVTSTNSSSQSLSASLVGGYYGGLGAQQQLSAYNQPVYMTYPGITQAEAPKPSPALEQTCDFHVGACSKVHPLKKLSRAIDKLRAEISAWHGDVLERCPA